MKRSKTNSGLLYFLEKIVRSHPLLYFVVRCFIRYTNIFEEDANGVTFLNLNKKVNQDLHDYSLRQIVIEETKNIRDLIVAKAFSNDSIKELPIGFFSDPIGINIEEFSNE